MSAVLNYPLRRTRRFPLDERLPDGTPAIEVARLRPRLISAEDYVDPTRLQGEGEGGGALSDYEPGIALNSGDAPLPAATRLRLATPPPAVTPPELVTGNTVGILRPDLDPSAIDPRVTAPGLEAPPIPQKRLGLVGLDVDPATAGMDTRPRVARPVEFLQNRVTEDLVRPVADHNGGLRSVLLGIGRGALRGLAAGGVGGALGGAAAGGVAYGLDHSLDEKDAADSLLSSDLRRFGTAMQTRKVAADVRGDELSNEYKAAQIPYLLARPELEQNKLDSLNDYRAGTLALRREAGESLQDYRNRTLGMRKDANESLDEYRDRMVNLGERRAAQGDRRITETERHNVASEALGGERVRQGDERIGLAREGLTLRERIASGNLDATWARIGQGYDRLDVVRQKQVDGLAAQAAKAEAEAAYFDQKSDPASATLKRSQAAALRKQAEEITARPVPRASRPSAPRTPPVGEEDFINAARQRMGDAFDEAQARAAYRRRYRR